jgi:hypothetical protein
LAEKVIRNNQSIVPFFGDRLSFIRGLDPLGLQNTSDSTFSMLLPGLNNVTGRVRYYSFYCWLLDVYSKQNGNTDPEEQKRFIRRAEYIIALASNYFNSEASSIPGSLYASRQIELKDEVVHDLQEGTYRSNGSTEGTYWKYPFGAFGQYYLGSLRDIGLLSNRENQVNVYVRTSSQDETFVSGEILASAFDKNLEASAKELFLNSINSGQISEAQLKILLPDFNLTEIPIGSEEQELLIKLFLQQDFPLRFEEKPAIYRKTTIRWLLEFARLNTETLTDRNFVYHCYNRKGLDGIKQDETLMGWYYYQFNEFWHYSNTAILNGTLGYLESTSGPSYIPLKELITTITEEVCHVFLEQQLINSHESAVNYLLERIVLSEEVMKNAIDESENILKIANGFLLFFTLYTNQRSNLFGLKNYAEERSLVKDGEGTTYFLNRFETKKELSIREYLFEYLFNQIIYRHQYVAFRKIGGGTQSTQKFIIEDQHIRYLGNFSGSYTGPRVASLISFLNDLKIISPSLELSSKGYSLLNNLIDGDN